MYEHTRVIGRLPVPLREALMRVDTAVLLRAQEIRLRADAPLTLSLPEGELSVCRDGRTVRGESAAVVICAPVWLHDAFATLCDQALYAHQQELVNGFITAQGGVRVGVAGTAVMADGKTLSVRDITSLCIRIPRHHGGCATPLCREIYKGGSLYSTLLVGAPASGKTSLLRDAASQLAAAHFRVAVADERGELSLGDTLKACDVLRGLPKAVAVEQAVRCLAPDVIVFDELGNTDEVASLVGALNSGVCVVGSVHASGLSQLVYRPSVRLAQRYRVFERVVLLKGRREVGQIERVLSAQEWEAYRLDKDVGRGFDSGGEYGCWMDAWQPSASSGEAARNERAPAAPS